MTGFARAEDCALKLITELPMIANETGSPVISIQIDNQAREVLLDTGGIWSMLSPSITGSFRSRASPVDLRLGLGGIALTKLVTAPSVQLGPLKFENVEFLEEPSRYFSVDGTLGANWLGAMDVELDPVSQKVFFFLKDHCDGKVVHWPHQDVAVVDMRVEHVFRHLTIPMELDGKEIRATIDTGAPDTVLSLRAAKRLFDLTPDSPGMIPSDSTPGKNDKRLPTWRYKFSSLEMNGIAFKNPWITVAETADGVPDLILGMHQMRGLHLYFAYGERKLYATSAQGDIAAQPAAAGDKNASDSRRPSPIDRVNAQDFLRNAQADLKQRDVDSAAANLDKAIAIDPTYAPAYAMRAGVYAAKGDRDHAMQALDQAISRDPGLTGAYLERSAMYEMAGDYQRAFADADQAVRAQPKSPVALNLRCWVGAIIGRLDGALADCNAALTIAPKAANILDSRALVHLKAGRLDDAIKDYDTALDIAPKMAPSLYGRGLAKRQKGDRAAGDADVAAAEQIEPGIAGRFGK